MRSAFAFTVAGLLGLAGSASAGILGTPAVLINASADQRVMCIVANRNTAPLYDVEIRIYGNGSSVRRSMVTTIPAGQSAGIIADADDLDVSSLARCDVEGSGVSKRTPVTLCVMPSSSPTCLAAVAVP